MSDHLAVANAYAGKVHTILPRVTVCPISFNGIQTMEKLNLQFFLMLKNLSPPLLESPRVLVILYCEAGVAQSVLRRRPFVISKI